MPTYYAEVVLTVKAPNPQDALEVARRLSNKKVKSVVVREIVPCED